MAVLVPARWVEEHRAGLLVGLVVLAGLGVISSVALAVATLHAGAAQIAPPDPGGGVLATGRAEQGMQLRRRRILLERVRFNWITGVLRPSLSDAMQLWLEVERYPEVLDRRGRPRR